MGPVFRTALMTTTLLSALATPAFAQSVDSTTASPVAAETMDSATEAEGEIVVTGSMFRRTDTETPSPLTVLSAADMDKAGITTISDAVRSISAGNSGSISSAFTNGFSVGGAAVSLRGIGVDSTLILIDGLRTANYPYADDGQHNYVDLNSIPASLIERIEVLKDGASSTYGADAIGGVVNMIMRKEIVGIEANAEAGISQRSDGGDQRLSFTAGTGRLDRDGFNIHVNAEYKHIGVIKNSDRGFPFNTNNLTSIGGKNNNPGEVAVPGTTISAIVRRATLGTPGNIFTGTAVPGSLWRVLNPAGCSPGTTPTTTANGSGCGQNVMGQYGTIQPEETRFGVSARATVQVNDDSQAYLAFNYYQNETHLDRGPGSIRNSNPVNTQTIALPVLLTNGQLNPNNPFAAEGNEALIYYLFGDIARSATYKDRVIRGAAGIDGSFGDSWNYSASATIVHNWLDSTQRGAINIAGLTQAVRDGSYNFVNPQLNTEAVRRAIAPDVRSASTSDLAMIQGTVSRELVQLPGGPLQFGVGGSIRYEKLSNPNANANAQTLNLNAVNAAGRHTVSSAFFELNAPVLDTLEIDLMGRYDHYSEGFSHFSPKVGAKFTPIPELAIRGTFSKGFRAPSFAESGTGNTVGYTAYTAPCSVRLQHGATALPGGGCTAGNAYVLPYSIGYNTSANSDLKPELSRSFTGGFVAQPTRWLNFTVDYYNIHKSRVIYAGPLGPDALNAYYAGQPLPDGYTLTLDAADPENPDGIRKVLLVNSPYVNAASYKTAGIDISAQVKLDLTENVRFTSTVDINHIFKFDFKPTADSPTQHWAGTQAPYNLSSGAGTPDWRGSWQNSIEIGDAALTATTYYTAGYKSVAEDANGPGTSCADNALYSTAFCNVDDFITVDLVGSYKLNDNFTFYVNVLNLFDAKPPVNPSVYAGGTGGTTGPNYNPTYTQAGAIGRFFRAGARVKF